MHCLYLTKAPGGAHFKYMNLLRSSGWEVGRRTTPETWSNATLVMWPVRANQLILVELEA